jgi:type II secretory pathway pseudopilin PulG
MGSRGNQFQAGYTLAFLMVVITIMNIAIAVALPMWTTYVQREKEAELIHRGLQYAEAIRVFQKVNNRPPISLEELYEKKPRSIRRLYEDPMTESGKWGLLIESGPAGAAGSPPGGTPQSEEPEEPAPKVGVGLSAPRQRGPAAATPAGAGRPAGAQRGSVVAIPPPKDSEDRGFGEPIQRTTGPIVGVFSAAEGTSLRKFMDAESYSQWQFKVDLIPVPAILGDQPAPRVTSAWIGKPFRDDIKVQQPGGGARMGKELGGGGLNQDQKGFRPSAFRPGKKQ